MKGFDSFCVKTLTHEYALVIIFSGVHLTAMATVCANPILYGFLNENFKQVSSLITILKTGLIFNNNIKTGFIFNNNIKNRFHL